MVRVLPLDPPQADVGARFGFLKGTGLAEAWDSLDHEALDREIEALFLGEDAAKEREDGVDGDAA